MLLKYNLKLTRLIMLTYYSIVTDSTSSLQSDGELEVSGQNNNCAALLESSRRGRASEDSEDEGEVREGEVETRPHLENFV